MINIIRRKKYVYIYMESHMQIHSKQTIKMLFNRFITQKSLPAIYQFVERICISCRIVTQEKNYLSYRKADKYI